MCPPENDRRTRKLEFTVVIGRWKIHHVSHVLIFIFLDFLISTFSSRTDTNDYFLKRFPRQSLWKNFDSFSCDSLTSKRLIDETSLLTHTHRQIWWCLHSFMLFMLNDGDGSVHVKRRHWCCLGLVFHISGVRNRTLAVKQFQGQISLGVK